MDDRQHELKQVLWEVKALAADYYRLTGRPLGVTGEVAEHVAADMLGLELAPPRTQGYDAIRHGPEWPERIQIKGRALGPDAKPGQRIGRINVRDECDAILLVLLDSRTMDPLEIWEAPFAAVVQRLKQPGSKARNERGSLAVSSFKRMARMVWSTSPQKVLTAMKSAPRSPRDIKYFDKKDAVTAELLRCARAGVTTTYGELGRRVGIAPQGPWKPLLDFISDEQAAEGLPDIAFLVINKGSGYPGQIGQIRARTPSDEQKALAERKLQEVFGLYRQDSAPR